MSIIDISKQNNSKTFMNNQKAGAWSMNIKPTELYSNIKAYQEQNNQAKRQEAYKMSLGHMKPDEVILSSQGSELGNYVRQIRETTDVRTDKIESLKSKVESGNYYVSAYDIASKIIDTQKGSL